MIVITALGGSAAAIEAMRRGAYDYLTKPFDLDEVLLTLKRALRQRALADEVRSLRAQAERGRASRPRTARTTSPARRPERGDARGLQGDRAARPRPMPPC